MSLRASRASRWPSDRDAGTRTTRPTDQNAARPDGARPPDPVDRECLGAYPSLEAFARDAVTALLRPEARWLLDCLDLPRVLQVLAGDDRLHLRDGRVYFDRRP